MLCRRSGSASDQNGILELKEAVANLELLEGEEKTENTTRYLNVISERTETLSRLKNENNSCKGNEFVG